MTTNPIPTPPSITLEEQARRRKGIDRARHSSAMEGGRSADVDRADQEAWVRGEITLEEAERRLRERYGVPERSPERP